MRRAAVLLLFVAALAGAVLLAAERARSLEAPVDRTGPVGSVKLPAAVRSIHVELVLAVRDPETGVTDVRASNGGMAWSEWRSLPPGGSTVRLPWDLLPGDGPKQVTLQARDGIGIVSTFVATTVLDTTAPTLLSSEPAGGAALAAPPAAIVLRFSEPLAASPLPSVSLPGGPELSVAVDGADVRITPRSPILPNASYVLGVDGVRDLAGNAAAAVTLPFSIDAAPATLSLRPSASLVTYGTTVTLRGAVVPYGATVTLDALFAGQPDPVTLGQVTASATGQFAFLVEPATNATFHVSYGGDDHYLAGAASADVAVRPRLSFSAPREFWQGQTRSFKGSVEPAHPGGSVVIQRKVDGVWTDWQSVTLDAASAYVLPWTPKSYGVSRFRAVMAADADHAKAATAARRVVVDNPNPHHISVLYRHFIVVDLSECHLYYYERGRVVRRFDCVVGKPSTPTPVGQWTVYQKVVGMWGPYGPFTMWYHTPYHFGIHGTNEPWLLREFPRHFSHGCTRLSNAHITWLFPRVPVGTPVRNIP